MALKNCIRCGQLMMDLGRVCAACRQKEEDEYKLVVDYLHENPGCTISQISEATGVRETIIMGLIRKGRLVADSIEVHCGMCGRAISATKNLLCQECQSKMDRDVSRVRKESPPPPPEPQAPRKPDKPGGVDDGAFSTVKRTKR